MIKFHSSLSQWRTTCKRKPKQNTADTKTTMILTHKEDTKASNTNAFHNQYHKIENIDPTTAPTTTWLTVWSFCDTRRYDWKQRTNMRIKHLTLDIVIVNFKLRNSFHDKSNKLKKWFQIYLRWSICYQLSIQRWIFVTNKLPPLSLYVRHIDQSTRIKKRLHLISQ